MIRLLEVIVTSSDEALAAEDGGAGRLELVADLARGGMTPPIPIAEAVLGRVRMPVRAMVRETEAHCVEDARIVARLAAQAGQLASLPLDGLVAGFVRDGAVDETLLTRVLDASRGNVTFHRAFEELEDDEAALAFLRTTRRVDRILTSGGPGSPDARLAALSSLARRAAPEIIAIAGGGLTLDLIARLAASSGEFEVHVGRLARAPQTVGGRVSAARVREIARLAFA